MNQGVVTCKAAATIEDAAADVERDSIPLGDQARSVLDQYDAAMARVVMFRERAVSDEYDGFLSAADRIQSEAWAEYADALAEALRALLAEVQGPGR